MCSTCGCGLSNSVEIKRPGGEGTIKIAAMMQNEPAHAHHHSHEHHHHDHHHHGHEHHGHRQVIDVETDILHTNNLLAERNRGFFDARNILALNLVSSPGSGKTSLLERTLREMQDLTFSVIEGDQQTTHDADRINATKVPVVQVNTGQGCHLDSDMINKAVKSLNPKDKSILFIENVGNLVCPALFKLGEDMRVVIISVTEGDDKPIKYPDMFAGSDLCIINKIDLLPYVDFDVQKAKDYALQVNHHLQFFELSARSGEGMEAWYDFLRKAFNDKMSND